MSMNFPISNTKLRSRYVGALGLMAMMGCAADAGAPEQDAPGGDLAGADTASADPSGTDVSAGSEEGSVVEQVGSDALDPARLADLDPSTSAGAVEGFETAQAYTPGPVNGFASLAGKGLSTTTGGGNAAVTRVANCSQLKSALGDSAARVIELPAGATIDCRTSARSQVACVIPCDKNDPGKNSYRIAVPGQTCRDLGSNRQTSRTRNETKLAVKSNKTVRGNAAVVLGAVFDLSNASNVILQNFAIEDINPGLIEAGDAITLSNSHHIWIDHLRFRLISDGHIDMKSSTNVTLSWNHFNGLNDAVCGRQHHYTLLVENTQATLHHNFFDRPSGRNPKLDGASTVAHLYNNHYRNISYFSIQTNGGAQARVEGNYFEDSRKPHWNQGGKIEAPAGSNAYTGRSTDPKENKDSNARVLSTKPYPYTLDKAQNVPSIVDKAAGPQK